MAEVNPVVVMNRNNKNLLCKKSHRWEQKSHLAGFSGSDTHDYVHSYTKPLRSTELLVCCRNSHLLLLPLFNLLF